MLINEVVINNEYDANAKFAPIGLTPNNTNVDYLGLRVAMRPSIFLKLAAPIGPHPTPGAIEFMRDELRQGRPFASPFLILSIPDQWKRDNYAATARVDGHEGRHRLTAILETEGDDPLEIHLFFRQSLRVRHIKPNWIEKMNQRLIPQLTTRSIPGPFFTPL